MFSEAMSHHSAAADHSARLAAIAQASAASSDAAFYDALGAVKVLRSALQRTSNELLQTQIDLDEAEESNRDLLGDLRRVTAELAALKRRVGIA